MWKYINVRIFWLGSNAMKINVLEYLQKTVAEVPDKVGFEETGNGASYIANIITSKLKVKFE